MTASIKKELIRCLNNLQDIPADKKPVIAHVIKELSRPDRTLPNSPEGKQIAGGLLNLLADLMPQINTVKNRELVDQLGKNIDAAITPAKPPSPKTTGKR